MNDDQQRNQLRSTKSLDQVSARSCDNHGGFGAGWLKQGQRRVAYHKQIVSPQDFGILGAHKHFEYHEQIKVQIGHVEYCASRLFALKWTQMKNEYTTIGILEFCMMLTNTNMIILKIGTA